jgi:hypothetical protein
MYGSTEYELGCANHPRIVPALVALFKIRNQAEDVQTRNCEREGDQAIGGGRGSFPIHT